MPARPTSSSAASLEAFKSALPLAEIVGRHVKLIRRGRSLTGLCPFHQEKSPSFNVVEEKGFYHCFGCGAHGTAIDFVMEVDGLDFVQAVELLAERTGQSSPLGQGAAPRVDPTLYDVNAAAAAWFEARLRGGEGRAAATYLERRGLDPAMLARFRLGFAPAGRTALKDALLAQGHGLPLLVEAGLVTEETDGRASIDRFRDRVVFPIGDARGRVVGFGGRALGDGKPKYLNSPETPLFAKGRLLYNQQGASAAARAAQTVLVVEGYMDVIGLAAAGFDHAVAPLGTAIGEDQLALLWKLADEPILCLDGDVAGLRAAARVAFRALPLLRPGKSLRFALLPEGQDPDSLVRTRGRGAMAELLASPLSLVDFLWRQQTATGLPDTPERRAAFEARCRELVRSIADPDIRSHYAQALREKLGAAGLGRRGAGRRRPGEAAWARATAGIQPSLALRSAVPAAAKARRLLRGILCQPATLATLEADLADLVIDEPVLAGLRGEILTWYAAAAHLDAPHLARHLDRHGYGRLVENVCADRPWVRGRLAQGVDPGAPSADPEGGAGLAEGHERQAEDGSAAGRFGALYRLLREPEPSLAMNRDTTTD